MAEAITKCGINAEYQMNFNCADLKKCGEISALLLGGEQEFYLNCGFCDFTYIQLNNFIQHILDEHPLELLENHSKQIKLEVPPCSQESLEQSGLENIAEVNVEENQKSFENYEESQDTDLLANDYENNLTSDAVIKAEFSQHPAGEENMATVEENWEGSEIDEHKQKELHNDIATNNFDVEMMSELEDSTNKTEIKTRRKYTKKTKTSQIEDLEGTNEVLKATSSKKHLQKKPKLIAATVKISNTILNVAECIILATAYKEYTCLWDENDCTYRFKNKRDDAFKSVHKDFNKKTGLHLTEYEFKKEVLILRKICTNEKKDKIMCKQKQLEYKPSCTYYDYIKYLEIDVPPFECPICEEQYPAAGKLKVHVASHDGSLPFKCNICGHGFLDGGNLTIHLRRHVQDHRHKCELCNKTCITTTELKSHMRTHTGERPFVCYMCGARTSTSSGLAEHIRRHVKDRCYKCEVCSKAFYSANTLRDHKKIHSDVRNYVCEICSKGFKVRHHLRQHKRLHSNVKEYVCKVCGRCFAQSGGLYGHMKSHHGLESNAFYDVPRRSLEDELEKNLSELDKHYIRTEAPKTAVEIINSLDDPELDASLEGTDVENGGHSSSFEVGPQPLLLEQCDENGNDKSWNLSAEFSMETDLDSSDQTNIPAFTGNIDDKDLCVQASTRKAKYNFCFFCKKMQTVISRHLEKVHKNESPVKKFAVLPKGNEERKKIIETIRLKGNYLYNTNRCYNKTGEMLVSRRPQKNRPGVLYKTCHQCRGVFSLCSIRRHRQKCMGASEKGVRSNTVLSRRIEGRLHIKANQRLVKVMSVLREDEIVRLTRYDDLLIEFGNCLCEKYYKQQQEEMIRNRLRTLGRLLSTMQEIDQSITDFKSIYHPRLYRTMVEAVRKISGFDPLTGVHQTPSLATSVGTYIKAVGDLLKLYYVENTDEEKEKIVDKYLFLHKMQYSQVINRVAREDQSEKHRQQTKPLPTTSDIKKLSIYVKNKMITSYELLQEQYAYQTWLNLLQYSLISIQTFNRRRAGEIERALIADLKSMERISETEHTEVYHKLSAEDKHLAQNFSRFIITGKLGRDVPVLLDAEMEKSIKLILLHRTSTKIPAKNPYIFGIPGFTDGRFKYLRACQLLRQFADECGAEHPERLRGTYLRKHVATTCAEENMDENKITDIANFMGHAEAIHRSHYRRSVVSRDVLGVANVLIKAQGDDNFRNNVDENDSTSKSQEEVCVENEVIDDETPSTSRISCITASNAPRIKKNRIVYSSSEEGSSDESSPRKTSTVTTRFVKDIKRKIRWSAEERKAAFDAFGDIIKNNQLPKTRDLKKFLKDNPTCIRTVNQLRTWASNEKKKYNLKRE